MGQSFEREKMMRVRMKGWRLAWAALLLLTQSLLAQGKKDQQEVTIYPPPPDTARIQYLTSISTSVDITGRRSGFWRFILGEDKGKPIVKPYGIAIRDGVLYIGDTIAGAVEIIDLKKKTFEYFRPGGFGTVKKPVNVFVDERNYLYVADADRRQIVVFDANRAFLRAIGDPKTMKPTDVFVRNDTVWVCDLKGQKIRFYDLEGNEFFSFPPDESQKGDPDFLYSPTNLTVRGKKIYVSDFGDFRIKVYDLHGKHLLSIGSYGRGLGQFVRPKGVAVDREGNIYVVDAAFENVQIFDPDGKLLMFFGGPYKKKGDMWLPAKVIIDYDNLEYFEKYVYKDFRLKYLIFVTNQYGPDKINVYGFVEYK
jgi:DNA-binding beta-propeller fold protein YncE